jgi:3-hydroxybutyryl-CoA dehydrogenase
MTSLKASQHLRKKESLNSKGIDMTQAIKIVGVVGAGTMGMGICEVAAANDCKVLVYDIDESFAQKSHNDLASRLKKRVIKGKISQQQADEITQAIKIVKSLDDFVPCDLVVEAVVENLEIKKQLFQQLEQIVSENALLSTNTSSISVTAIASVLNDPSRLFGLHFFNPAPVMKLVEIIKGLKTKDEFVQQAKMLCKKWKKVPVVAQSTPGFIVNRVARPYYGEALKMCQEKLASITHIDTVFSKGAGFRMGPFELMDLIGIDINYAVSQTVYKEMYQDPRYKPSLIQGEMVHANLLGRKTGEGFYQYGEANKLLKPEFLHSEAHFDQFIVPEEITFLSRMFSEFDSDDRKWQGDKVIISGCQLLLSDGLTARQIESRDEVPTCLVDLSFDFMKAECVNLSFSPSVDIFMKNRIVALFNQINKAVLECPDQPGLIATRTIAMLINEAADAVFNGVCSEDDVDLAMQYGVNYPKGLLAFGQEIGWHQIANTIEHLQHWFGDDRYRLSPYIRNQL